VEGRGV